MEDSRSDRAEASSGDVADVARERMRRYDVKRERAVWSWARTSLSNFGPSVLLYLNLIFTAREART